MVYHNRPKTWNLDMPKPRGSTDREPVHIPNIDRLMIAQPQELSRGPDSKFLADCGINSTGVHIALSADETHLLGKTFGSTLPKNAVIALFGDLGAGKTTFIRGLAEGIGSIDPRNVSSPTFTLLNIYEGDKTVYHFDLYRLQGKEDFFNAGFDEYFTAGGICCMEWAEKIVSELPANTIKVNISYLSEEKRQIEIS